MVEHELCHQIVGIEKTSDIKTPERGDFRHICGEETKKKVSTVRDCYTGRRQMPSSGLLGGEEGDERFVFVQKKRKGKESVGAASVRPGFESGPEKAHMF